MVKMKSRVVFVYYRFVQVHCSLMLKEYKAHNDPQDWVGHSKIIRI